MEQIEELHSTVEALKQRLAELEELTTKHRLANQEFEFFQQMIGSFSANIDDCTVEEKRRLLRTIVRKVVWDGENALVYLFAADGDLDFAEIDDSIENEVPLGKDSE